MLRTRDHKIIGQNVLVTTGIDGVMDLCPVPLGFDPYRG